ncbi:MAG: lipopolysaccharide transport periplasmic protein LptA [Rubrivivax sp.]|nr:lipopolysaccharide transport periplasmic protein LptA [Rubrivivax sp.]
MKTFHHTLLLGLLSSLLAAGAHAEKADRDQPMHIEADALRHEETTQTSVFTGNVVLTKGSIVLRGARLEVRQAPDGSQFGTATAAPGKRAFFRQKRDTVPGAPEEFVEGEAEVIDYDGRADLVKLQRRAELRRYRAGSLNDEVSGALITYNNTTDVFTVDSAPGKGSGADGRVRAMLSPKEAGKDAGRQGGAPAEPPALRASPQLAPAR